MSFSGPLIKGAPWVPPFSLLPAFGTQEFFHALVVYLVVRFGVNESPCDSKGWSRGQESPMRAQEAEFGIEN